MTAPWKHVALEHENPFLKYFDSEMRYLRAASAEFAKAQPDAARRMGMRYGEQGDSVRATFEGFALLMARLRMKLDDGNPEFTEALIDNLYEHAARAIPSLSIIECTPLGRGAASAATPPRSSWTRSAVSSRRAAARSRCSGRP